MYETQWSVRSYIVAFECTELSPLAAGEFLNAFKKLNNIRHPKISPQLLQITWGFENFSFKSVK